MLAVAVIDNMIWLPPALANWQGREW